MSLRVGIVVGRSTQSLDTTLTKALQISKLDAAKRQLETAVRLYFHEGDPVSIHSLVAAAFNVIRDVNVKRGGERMTMKDVVFDHVKPEKRDEVRALMNRAENFFKHADRDHEATLDFDPSEAELLLYEACAKYWQLTGEHPPLFQIQRAWFIATHSHLFHMTAEMERMVSRAKPMTEGGRTAYFNTMLPLVMKSGV